MSKGYTIERDWTTAAGLRAVVIRLQDRSPEYCHRCGYVEVPKGHPLYGVDYDQNTAALIPPSETETIGKRGPFILLDMAVKGLDASPSHVFDVHGGLTFASGKGKYPVESDGWWFGFDAGHLGDDLDGGQPQPYMEGECESLAKQIVEKTVSHSSGDAA